MRHKLLQEYRGFEIWYQATGKYAGQYGYKLDGHWVGQDFDYSNECIRDIDTLFEYVPA